MEYYKNLSLEDLFYIDDDGLVCQEEWKDVVGYEGFYLVSNLGNVRRKGKLNLKKPTPRFGYLQVELCDGRKPKIQSIHRLVAMAFIDNPENKKEVNHINGKKDDNSAVNLEWATRRSNLDHAMAIGLTGAIRGENSCKCKITEEIARDIKFNFAKRILTNKHFAEKYNIPLSTVMNITNKKAWKWLL